MKCVLKRHDSSSNYKEGEISLMVLENNKVEVHMFQKDVKSVEDAQKMVYSRSTLMKVLKIRSCI